MNAAAAIERRELFDAEHRDFRESAARFLAEEVVPGYGDWNGVPADVYVAAAGHGFVGMQIGERHGGAAVDDVRFSAVLVEEAMRAGAAALALGLGTHNDIGVSALLAADAVPLDDWAPGLADGTRLVAFADGDLTAARRGETWTLDGDAAFVVNGMAAGLVLAVAAFEHDVALFAVEADEEGVTSAPSEPLIGLHAADLADVRFIGVRAIRLGGADAVAAARRDQQLSLAVAGAAGARAALEITLEYVRDRRAFGQPIASFENTRMALGAVGAELQAVGALVDACLTRRNEAALDDASAAAAKLCATELLGRAADVGVQLHGGYGYMTEYAIARAYADARFLRVHGGPSAALRGRVAEALGL